MKPCSEAPRAAGAIVVAVAGATTAVTLTTHPPAPLALPSAHAPGAAPSTASLAGVWNAGPSSVVGWRAQQVLIGERSTLAGRTGEIWGSITVTSGVVTAGAFTVDMAGLTASLAQSTRSSVFGVAAYPTAQLRLTRPIPFGTIPAQGVVERLPETATLTLHGVSRPVRFTASTELLGGTIYVLADIGLPFGEWGISVGGIPFLADIDSPATIEVLLALTRGPGNQAPAAAAGAASVAARR